MKSTLVIFVLICSMCAGCRERSGHVLIEIRDLSGSWQLSDQDIDQSVEFSDSVKLEIDDDGHGKFSATDRDGGVEEFDFEMLVGSEKLALFSNDGRQFVYKFRLVKDELVLESVVDGTMLVMGRAN